MKLLIIGTVLVLETIKLTASQELSKEVTIETSDEFIYHYLNDDGYSIQGFDSILFKVRAANDAHLTLSRNHGEWKTNSYEIVIGGWTNAKSAIRKCDQCLPKSQYDHKPLDAAVYKAFWISWKGGLIQAGSGSKPPSGVFLEWQDDTPHQVNYIGISTGWKANGSWIFDSIDGGWSKWSPYTECSLTCGNGTRTRNRTCDNPQPFNGRNCSDVSFQISRCSIDPCPIDGGWSDWNQWSSCSVSCDNGTKTRNRTCDSPAPQHNGIDCTGRPLELQDCHLKKCAINGSWSSWSLWQQCSHTCGNGTQIRERLCDNPAAENGGLDCPGSNKDFRGCSERKCPVDGRWSLWASWKACSAPCGSGISFRNRSCNNPKPQHGGDICDGEPLAIKDCQIKPCPIHGGWTDWTPWSNCSLTCGNGTVHKTRNCSNPTPRHGGLDCQGPDIKLEACSMTACPVDGGWTEWNYWSICSTSCGPGVRIRTRKCSDPVPRHGGEACAEHDKENITCMFEECDDNYVYRRGYVDDSNAVDAPGAQSIGVIGMIIMCTLVGFLVLLDLRTFARQLRLMKNNLRRAPCCPPIIPKKNRQSPYIVETNLPSTSHYTSYDNVDFLLTNNSFASKSLSRNELRPKAKKEKSARHSWPSTQQDKSDITNEGETFDNLFDVMEYNYASMVNSNTGSSGYATEYSYAGSLTGRFDRTPTTSLEHRRGITLPVPATSKAFDYRSIQKLASTKI